jgi:hypothetical protein
MNRKSDWAAGLFWVAGGSYCLVFLARDFFTGEVWAYYSGTLLLAGGAMLALGGRLIAEAVWPPRE